MSKGEREEGKEGKGRGRSGRAWWAEERIWAFTPREEEQDQCENQAIWSRSTIHFVKMLRMHLWLQGKASYS